MELQFVLLLVYLNHAYPLTAQPVRIQIQETDNDNRSERSAE